MFTLYINGTVVGHSRDVQWCKDQAAMHRGSASILILPPR